MIASKPRLRVLSHLTRSLETNPTTLAVELDMPLNVLSVHLRTLATAGLVKRRRAGAWSYYRAESPYNQKTLSGQLLTWLRAVLQTPKDSVKHLGLHEVRHGLASATSLLHRTVFEAATAFTDLRRLQILRHLAHQDGADARQLVDALSMSEQALSRHMTKLRRRGFVQTRRVGRTVVYDLSRAGNTLVHACLFEIVRAAWEKKPSRTS